MGFLREPHFLLSGCAMAKPFLTYDQQIDKLVNEKNLVVDKREYAISILKRTSYFALICGYKDPFKNPTTKKYVDNTTIYHIHELYKLDENLRELFLKYMMMIERNIRSLVSYYFCEQFGDEQNKYLDVNNYEYRSGNIKDINGLVCILGNLVKSYEHIYVNHHRKNHNNVPLWVLVNTMTFGQISKMYALMQQKTQSSIGKNFDGVKYVELYKMLRVMTKFRNVCAHGERLFSYRVSDDIPDMLIHQSMKIVKKGIQYKNGKNDLFSVVIMFRYLLGSDDFANFKNKLESLIELYKINPYSLQTSELLEYMGFPINWKGIDKAVIF